MDAESGLGLGDRALCRDVVVIGGRVVDREPLTLEPGLNRRHIGVRRAELPAELLRREIAAVLRATRIGHGAGKCFDTVSPTEVDAEADRVVRIDRPGVVIRVCPGWRASWQNRVAGWRRHHAPGQYGGNSQCDKNAEWLLSHACLFESRKKGKPEDLGFRRAVSLDLTRDGRNAVTVVVGGPEDWARQHGPLDTGA